MSTTSASSAKSATTATFITALVFNLIVFGAEILLFTILRPRFDAIYQPRTYAPIESKRSKPIGASLLAWPLAIWRADYRDIINANGLDAYFFVRFLRMMTKVLFPIWIISWAVLLPISSVQSTVPGNKGLDLFTFGNIAPNKQNRYAAFIVLEWIFIFWIFYNIRKEMSHYIIKRQQHLIDPVHAQSVQSKTLLVTGIPAKYLNESALLALFNHLPGGVNKVWLNRDLKDLPKIYDRRLAACKKLESAETKLMRTAAKLRLAEEKAASKGKHPKNPTIATSDPERNVTNAEKFVPRDQRPSHKLGLLGLFGKKVDSIEWAREEIQYCNERLDRSRGIIERDVKINLGEEQGRPSTVKGDDLVSERSSDPSKKAGKKDKNAEPTSFPPLNSAFITFNRQLAAYLALDSLTHHEPYRMAGKYVEMSPDDVIWSNLSMNPYEIKLRQVIGYAMTAALIIFWAIPVAFVGIVSNIHALSTKYAWLHWLNSLPSPVIGIISGILPPVLLAVLMMLLPIILRQFIKFEGMPSYNGLELGLMNRFFIFQVVHSFLIVTISSGIISSLSGIVSNPSSAATLLAHGLPNASVFFLTYIVLQGLAGTAGGFLQIVALIVYYVKLVLLGSTPRSIYNIKFGLRSVAWGTLFPGITLLVVITLGYLVIAPIINGFACVTFAMFYMLYKYLFLYQFDMPASKDTGGLFFPKAIQHIFVGIYVQEVCLAALFFLAQDGRKKPSAFIEGIFTIILIVVTILYHLMINNSYGPLVRALPLSLADKMDGATDSMIDRDEDREDRDAAADQVDGVGPTSRGPVNQQQQAAPGALDYGYAHPATSRPQQTVWIPIDTMGIGLEEEQANAHAGILTSTRNAEMNEKGKVEINGAPPDEEVKV